MTTQETKVRLVGLALEALSAAILLDDDHTLSHDTVALHHVLVKENRRQLHRLGNDAQRARCAKEACKCVEG